MPDCTIFGLGGGPMNFVTRKMTPDDLPFLLNSWLLSGKDKYCGDDDMSHAYFTAMEPRFKQALQDHEVLIMCNDEEPRQIFGWICFDSRFKLVHFVYIKRRWRKMRMATTLLGATHIDGQACTTCPSNHPRFTYIGGI
jgi:hypothetical protein